MNDFKVGDRVKLNDVVMKGGPEIVRKGLAGTVEIFRGEGFEFPIGIRFDGREGLRFFAPHEVKPLEGEAKAEKVDHPSHYTWLPNGLEVIDLTECLNFNRGNAVKYVCRAGRKDPATELEDLHKARWYIQREIKRVEEESKSV